MVAPHRPPTPALQAKNLRRCNDELMDPINVVVPSNAAPPLSGRLAYGRMV